MKLFGDGIGAGKACIVVREDGLDQLDHPFWKWLDDEGFKPWGNHGHYNRINWVFINLDSMIYAPGMPGVKITSCIRERQITSEEFKTIWSIFKQHEEDDYRPQNSSDSTEPFRISPAVPDDAKICHIFSIDDAEEAAEQLEIECIKSYGDETRLSNGTLLHDNYECEDGYRSLLRCKHCGGLLLVQVSKYSSTTGDDGYFEDILPVWSEEEADLLNTFLGPRSFADHPFRHLRRNNQKYCWIGKDAPRPMDIPELKTAIGMKYKDQLEADAKKPSEETTESSEDDNGEDDPAKRAFVETLKETPPEDVVEWAPIFDETDDEDQELIHMLACFVDSYMRTDEIGFGNTHFTFKNDTQDEEVSWKRTNDGYAIKLSADMDEGICVLIHQLGYTMMHCLIDHIEPDESKRIRWAEDLICEAAGLAVLGFIARDWEEGALTDRYPDYPDEIWKYIGKSLHETGTSALLRCIGKEALAEINKDPQLKDIIDESHDLCYYIQEGCLTELAQVRKYAFDSLLLNTHEWKKAPRSGAIDYVCRIQERIPGCEVLYGIAISVQLYKSTPTAEEMEKYEDKIRILIDNPEDFVIFETVDSDDPSQRGLLYYQMCVDHDDILRTELCYGTDNGLQMFARESSREEAIAILRKIVDGEDPRGFGEWRDVSKEVFSEDENENDDGDDTKDMSAESELGEQEKVQAALRLFLENPYWRRYYETAPSELCKQYIEQEFCYSQYTSPEAYETIIEIENMLSLDDWKHLLTFCGNNPRRAFIKKVIQALETNDPTGIRRNGQVILNPNYHENT